MVGLANIGNIIAARLFDMRRPRITCRSRAGGNPYAIGFIGAAWIPACAGMTNLRLFEVPLSKRPVDKRPVGLHDNPSHSVVPERRYDSAGSPRWSPAAPASCLFPRPPSNARSPPTLAPLQHSFPVKASWPPLRDARCSTSDNASDTPAQAPAGS